MDKSRSLGGGSGGGVDSFSSLSDSETKISSSSSSSSSSGFGNDSMRGGGKGGASQLISLSLLSQSSEPLALFNNEPSKLGKSSYKNITVLIN